MTEENKQLLLKDICARLPYGNTEVKVIEPTNNIMDEVFVGKHICSTIDIEDFILGRFIVKPYLRPMSSMTDEEENEYRAINCYEGLFPCNEDALDYALEHHLDFRGLIPMGLALEAPNNMYKTE